MVAVSTVMLARSHRICVPWAAALPRLNKAKPSTSKTVPATKILVVRIIHLSNQIIIMVKTRTRDGNSKGKVSSGASFDQYISD
jgi:hypothetical protein